MEPGKYDISPFSRGYPPGRDDVGIVPYIPSGCIPFNGAVKYSAPTVRAIGQGGTFACLTGQSDIFN